jgi:sphinganine-1-phosphate aldolase
VDLLQNVEIGGAREVSGRLGRPATVRSSLMGEGSRSWKDISADLVALKNDDYDWRGGRVPIYVYFDNDQLLTVARNAYGLYFSENALGGRAFPSLVRMEEEIIRTSLTLFHAPEGAAGSFTSGGTESIFLAMKSARDRFRAIRPNGPSPTVIVPQSAHPAFNKAGHYLDVEVIRAQISRDLRGDVKAMRDAIDDRTAMVVGSAPCYPYGVYDSIAELGELAIARGLWLHVDACLGGFLAPFAKEEGYPIPDFDFSVPGVTSLSADLHKYGFSAKGASVVLYRSGEFQKYQAFHFEDWPRGSYSTETFLGSRPGGAIASAWAVFQYLGHVGYRRLARKTMQAKEQLVSGIEQMRELEVIRPSELSIVLYKSTDHKVDINAVAEMMGEKGWFVGRSREPPAIHLALNAVHASIVGDYLNDLGDVVEIARLSGRTGVFDERTY